MVQCSKFPVHLKQYSPDTKPLLVQHCRCQKVPRTYNSLNSSLQHSIPNFVVVILLLQNLKSKWLHTKRTWTYLYLFLRIGCTQKLLLNVISRKDRTNAQKMSWQWEGVIIPVRVSKNKKAGIFGLKRPRSVIFKASKMSDFANFDDIIF